jgi:hypothetical protein
LIQSSLLKHIRVIRDDTFFNRVTIMFMSYYGIFGVEVVVVVVIIYFVKLAVIIIVRVVFIFPIFYF